MKKMKLILAVFAIFCLHDVEAQSHNMGANYNCKLQKKGYFFSSEKHACPACKKLEDKEKEAKKTEDKRKADLAVAKAKADKEAREKVAKLKRTEEAKNEKPDVVVSNLKSGNNTKDNIKSKEIIKPATKNTGSKSIMYGSGVSDIGSMLHLNGSMVNFFGSRHIGTKIPAGDTILINNDYFKTYGPHPDQLADFPPGIGIVEFKTQKLKGNFSYFICDIVDSKGKRYFNDDNIETIMHLFGNYFIVCRENSSHYGSDQAYTDIEIVNIVSKEKFIVTKEWRKFLAIARSSNGIGNSYGENLRAKGSYKACLVVQGNLSSGKFRGRTVYYVTLDNKIEEDQLQ